MKILYRIGILKDYEYKAYNKYLSLGFTTASAEKLSERVQTRKDYKDLKVFIKRLNNQDLKTSTIKKYSPIIINLAITGVILSTIVLFIINKK